ncbi:MULTISPECIES: hypothetical protein [unclassified Variovorax]|uniref:hypothetical protein n=1 Tax=unclassified Variovorax TaxID=663243 RepID=UPI00076CA96B|nr:MULTISPECIES: hypothetical protein [unclassified Variovorax]KWT89295.1 hypothetical protein APY03_3374 [Variovorax sp. WDL1]PNG56472.1 hypothetical protein CHC07_02889 [Variovorax sp. B4]PNG57895.1 hypothetical protein CHC06_02891 [Variovorax sp. B2]VTV09644.1 hypothetical protein WDL1CHR_00735 [Variovorax sp. WDL1]
MNWNDFRQAVDEAKTTIDQGDNAARQLAKLMRGRLRIAAVDPGILADLKRELRDFDITTGKWKVRP